MNNLNGNRPSPKSTLPTSAKSRFTRNCRDVACDISTLGLILIGGLILAIVPATASFASLPPGPTLSAGATATPTPAKSNDDKVLAWDKDIPLEARVKIDPRLIQELNGEIIPAHLGGQVNQTEISAPNRKPLNRTRFLVFLKSKTNLKVAAEQSYTNAGARRTAVAKALLSTAQTSQGPLKTLLNKRLGGGSVTSYQPFYIFNGFAVEGDLNTIIELAKQDEIERISANYPLFHFDDASAPVGDQSAHPASRPANSLGGLNEANWNIDLVDAERVWNELGVRGEGAVVGSFDSGVDWTHPALQPQYRGYSDQDANHNYNWFAPNGDLYPNGNLGPSASNTPYDCEGHGTHTMGTMVGDGGTAATKVGMAPGAKWIAVPGLCDDTMPGSLKDDIGGAKAFQWFLCPTDLTGDLSTRNCAQAPDVVNNSWGSSNPADDTFRPAIQALRAAGITPVFAAGNPEAGPGSIGSPGSVPEAITVGATDRTDRVASFSGRGPSFYEGEQKPELSAPGVDVNSTASGGGYLRLSGTSMAAPAVSGLVALMVSADLQDGRRDLNVDEIEAFMTHTGVDLGPAGPDNDYGYGRIDAYKAARWVLSAGDLRGTIEDAATAQPIRGANVAGVSNNSGDTFTVSAGPGGVYSTTVPGGVYSVTVSAFGYYTQTFANVSVITHSDAVVNFNLVPQPTTLLTGLVLSGTVPISGALVSVDAFPTVSFTTGADGLYTLTLPTGAFTLTVKAAGYRVRRETVTVNTDSSTHNFTLIPAPAILLVEADAGVGWFFGRPARNFFKRPLDQRGYLYDLWPIQYTHFNDTQLMDDGRIGYGVPSVATLSAYDLVIWVHSGCQTWIFGCSWGGSPDSVGANDELTGYLNAGGRLIISGQDIGYWDQDTSFYQNYLHAVYRNDIAAREGETASGSGFLSGLNLTLDEAALYDYPNSGLSLKPDGVNPRDGNAYPIMTYDSVGDNGNGAAALAIDPCGSPYRVVYFAVGYENLGPRAAGRFDEYAEILDRSIQWVMSSKPTYGVNTLLIPGRQANSPGLTANYNLTIMNLGLTSDAYNLSLMGQTWPTRILSGESEVRQVGPIAPCGSQALTVEVAIPGATRVDIGNSDTFTVTAVSQVDPLTQSSSSGKTTAFPSWQTETPMPTSRYRLAAAALPGTPYYFAIGGQNDIGEVTTNERYDAYANTWTTMAKIPQARGNINAAELNGKIYVVGGYSGSNIHASTFVYDPARNSWSTAADLPVPLDGVALAAANGKLYAFGGGDGDSDSEATYEYDPENDTWAVRSPMPGGSRVHAAAAELGGKIYVVGGWPSLKRVEIYNPANDSWSTAAPMNLGRQSPGLTSAPDGYLYVSGGGNEWDGLAGAEQYDPAADTWTPIPALNDPDRAGSASVFVAGRVFAVGGTDAYLTPTRTNESLRLGDAFLMSTKRAQPTIVQPDEYITYTIELHSDAFSSVNAGVIDPIPSGVTFAGFGPSTISSAPHFDLDLNRIEWQGNLPAGQPPISFTFKVRVNSLGWEAIVNTATFDNGSGFTFDRSTYVIVNDLFDLSSSTKSVNKTAAQAGDTLTYTIRLQNTSTQTGAVTLFDPIPPHTTYVPGSLTYTLGAGSYADDGIVWTGNLSRSAYITFAVRAAKLLTANTWITNTAIFTDHRGVVYRRSAGVVFNMVNLTNSIKAVDRPDVTPGELVTYTILLTNTSDLTTTAIITDPIPSGITYVLGSSAVNGNPVDIYNELANRLEWTGLVPAHSGVVLHFQAHVAATNGVITNTATIDDGAGSIFERQAVIIVSASIRRVFLPIVIKEETPLPPRGE